MKNNNFTNKNQVIEVDLGGLEYVNFTFQSYKELKEEYESSLCDLLECEFPIISEWGNEVMLSCTHVKYIILYLEMKFFNKKL